MSRATHMMSFLGNEHLPILIVAIQPLQVKESKVTRARIVDTPSSVRSRACRWRIFRKAMLPALSELDGKPADSQPMELLGDLAQSADGRFAAPQQQLSQTSSITAGRFFTSSRQHRAVAGLHLEQTSLRRQRQITALQWDPIETTFYTV